MVKLIRVKDRILNIHSQALQLLLESTTGRARKLIDSCVMLSPDKALDSALNLLYKTFGSPAVAVKAHLKLVSEGPPIRIDERGLQDFYSDLINCKTVVEAGNAAELLNTPAIAEGIFSRFPRNYQERFVELALRKGYDMEIVPFDLFIEFVNHSQRVVSSRLGRLIKTSKDKFVPRNTRPGTYNPKPARAHTVQSVSKPLSLPKPVAESIPAAKENRRCPACDADSHVIWHCELFCKMSVSERKGLVKQKRLCFNCLGLGHMVSQCRSKARCKTCQQSHHSLLHLDSETKKSVSTSTSSSSSKEAKKGEEIQNCKASCAIKSRGRLQVLPVRISNTENGKSMEILALLDSGADTHLLSHHVYDQLNLSGRPVRSSLQLADGSVKTTDTMDTNLVINGVGETESFVLHEVRVVDSLPDFSDSIPSPRDLIYNEHLQDIDLPIIDSERVDLLIGTCSPEMHVFSEVREGGSSGLWAGKSRLGWVLFGKEPRKSDNFTASSASRVNLIKSLDLDKTSELICPCQLDFVDLSQQSSKKLPSQDDERATKIMHDSCTRNDGHYCIRLPWKEGCPNLPDNFRTAASRLKGLGHRLQREPEIHDKYRDKINEMIRLGHAIEITEPFDKSDENKQWYIPHHYTSGKFRVVFDCAASHAGTSINQQLLQGPDNTNTLIGVLFRFRLHSVAIVGDIRNMFHQVKVDPVDQTALRFLWWEDGDPNKAIKIFKLTVHTFGLTSSPSVAGFALRRTAEENRTNASTTAMTAIQRHLYVDDLLMSVENSDKAVHLLSELTDLLASGGFQLAKQSSNCREVIETIPADLLAPQLSEIDIHVDNLPSHKTLGLVWDPNKDRLCIKADFGGHPFTRRGLLSVLASIYDPLGLIAPYMLPAKLLLQRLANQGLDWDSKIPNSDCVLWEKWLKSLPKLSEVSIPRLHKNFTDAESCELHCFADASSDGFGAVCYFRICKSNQYVCSFVIGKSRVSPVKTLSTPRLELCAAVVAVRLAKMVESEHDIFLSRIVFWSDSTTVLAYLRNTSKRRPAFETHRINLIRTYSETDQWRWVDTNNNPADLYSRGVSPRYSDKATKWLQAPFFLSQEESTWPQQPGKTHDEPNKCDLDVSSVTLERCFSSANVVQGNETSSVITNVCSVQAVDDKGLQDPLYRLASRYSTLQHSVKSTAWLLRMKELLRKRAACVSYAANIKPISAEEYDTALLALLRLAQQQSFPNLVEALENSSWHEVLAGKQGKSVKTIIIQPLKKFCPLVKDGVIRIGGRLQRSSLPMDFKHPIVLPKRHHVTRLIVLSAHCESGHSGAQYVLNKLRDRFHIVGQCRTVRHYIKQDCMVCRNLEARLGSQLMAPLPPARVEAGCSAYENCGVDYMGPLEIKQGRNRLKRYCCVFTCLATRATHLEVAYDLSTESFLMALRRFLSTRGHSTRVIFSDNGTNFVGARSELQRGIKRLNQNQILNELSPKGIMWNHAPPLASHQGGIYESIIRLIRKAMTAIMSDKHVSVLTDEGLITFLKEVEYILNCRPLTQIDANEDDVKTLSPIMLLTGCVDPGFAPDVFMSADRLRSSWRACQFQIDEFWRRWQSEYLHLLQRRQKWLTPERNLKLNDLVLLFDESQPRNVWPKGIVVEVFPDRDNLVRRAKVKTASGKTLMRDVRKLCLLEADVDDSNALR